MPSPRVRPATAASPAAARPVPASAGPTEADHARVADARAWGRLFGEAALPAAEVQVLDRCSRGRRLEPGETVFRRGQRAGTLVALMQGDAALGGDANGQFRTEGHVQAPAWLDASAGWLGEAHLHDARALGPAVVVEIDATSLAQALERQPALAQRLLRTLAREVRVLAANAKALMHQDAPARWAGWLLAHCRPLPATDGRHVVQLPLRKRDIASQLAITPETLSRLMRSFSAQGVIEVEGYTVKVLDLPALERLAAA